MIDLIIGQHVGFTVLVFCPRAGVAELFLFVCLRSLTVSSAFLSDSKGGITNWPAAVIII